MLEPNKPFIQARPGSSIIEGAAVAGHVHNQNAKYGKASEDVDDLNTGFGLDGGGL